MPDTNVINSALDNITDWNNDNKNRALGIIELAQSQITDCDRIAGEIQTIRDEITEAPHG